MWINSYKASPWYKSVLKELHFLGRFAVLFAVNGFKARTVLFYPEFPVYRTQINKVLRRAGYNITNNPQLPCELVFAWQDTTFREPQPLLEELARHYRVLNINCTDISKERVEKVHRAVFGYGLAVDPLNHQGPCVRKGNVNAQHDAEIIQCPIAAPEPGYIYQRLIDNQVGEGVAGDMRIPIYGSCIPLVYKRYRPLHLRFHGDFRIEVHDPEAFLSPHEIKQILRFARAMGLDYGDLDVLRDPEDDRLYVVDVNNTPFNSNHISRADMRRAVERASRAFLAEFAGAPNDDGWPDAGSRPPG